MSITTHVLNTASGLPGEGIDVVLEFQTGGSTPHKEEWTQVASGVTNSDGRVPDFVPKEQALAPGTYRITFDTAGYFKKLDMPSFYPYAAIVFEMNEPDSHYHVPLLISGFGFSTYRGS